MTFCSVIMRLVAFGLAIVFFFSISHYPLKTTYLLPIILIYIAVMFWYPQLWLFALPTLIPALDLAPWTGWFFFEEIDLLLLITVSFGYWRLGNDKPHANLPSFAVLCATFLSLAYLIGTYRGLIPFSTPDVNTFNSYLSSYNSLRLSKAWIWMLLLLPLLTRSAGADLVNLRRRLIFGMLTGLILVSSAVIWERLTFPGFLNFSSDYRTTAPFSAMHTGGAALDGFLALSFPLSVVLLLRSKHPIATLTGLFILALGGYAGLTTFSRGLYFAYAFSVLIIMLFLIKCRIHILKNEFGWRSVCTAVLLCTTIIYVLIQMFLVAGYRGFVAAIILLFAAWMASTSLMSWRAVPVNAFVGVAIEVLLFCLLTFYSNATSGIFKPPYFLFSLSILAFGVTLTSWHAPLLLGDRISPSLIVLIFMSINMIWIAYHWGGAKTIGPAIGICVLAALLVCIHACTRDTFQQENRIRTVFPAALAIIALMTIPIVFSYSASERFSRIDEDFRYRARHWEQVLDMMNGDYETRIAGVGLGKFPKTYFLHNALHEFPPTMRYMEEIGNRYMRLTGPSYSSGIGELLRLLQRISLRENRSYIFAMDIRNVTGKTPFKLGVALCERLLLYHKNCVSIPLSSIPHDSFWHHFEVTLHSGKLGTTTWNWRAPIQLEVAIEGSDASLDFDNISLRDQGNNRELISNGSFTDTNDYWFFSSDHHHLPWHVKNMSLNIYFELGLAGIVALYSLLWYSLVRLFLSARNGQIESIALLSALCGFLMVGLTDSLLDVPRIGLLFFLILLSSVLQPITDKGRRFQISSATLG